MLRTRARILRAQLATQHISLLPLKNTKQNVVAESRSPVYFFMQQLATMKNVVLQVVLLGGIISYNIIINK